MGVRFFRSLHLGHKELGLVPILCNAGFKGKGTWMSLYQMEKRYSHRYTF